MVLEKGEIPPREPGQIYVSNHSTVIDIVVLMKGQLYSLSGQEHEGTIGFFQKYILFPMGNLWFNRKENKDRIKVAKAIEVHSMDTYGVLCMACWPLSLASTEFFLWTYG